jgi:iron complex outermembrane recepter protein
MTKHMAIAFLMSGSAIALMLTATPVAAQVSATQRFDIPAQDAETALAAFAQQTQISLAYTSETVRGVRTAAVRGQYEPRKALEAMFQTTHLNVVSTNAGGLTIVAGNGDGGHSGNKQANGEIVFAEGEIVVTATRRNQNLNDVPMSISALSENSLQQRGIRSSKEIAYAVPGLSFTSDNDGLETLTVRGIVTLGSKATTAFYLDETPISQIGGGTYSPRYFDIERVEVLRGPQGTLYGASAMGGALRIITNKPNASKFEGTIRVEGSATRHADANFIGDAALNIPIIPELLAVRVTGFYERQPCRKIRSTMSIWVQMVC